MGWSSGDDIFDGVATFLIDRGDVSPELLRDVCAVLIDKLRDVDWDTWDESLSKFALDPAVLEAFHRNSCGTTTVDGLGELVWHERSQRWSLQCSEHGVLDGAEATADGHDRLVFAWARHDNTEHGGVGRVDRSMLLDPSRTVMPPAR